MPGELTLAAQALATGVAGVVLWLTWRGASRGGDPWTSRVVTAGFLLRAAAGLALFWMSYLRLPLLSSRSLGEGFWTFALDSTYYMPLAQAARSHGLLAIVTLERGTWASISYLQVLSLAQALFGSVVSVGLLVNCVCFLGGALLLVRWSASLGPAGRIPGLLALAVVSFQPSWILWSTQPLKEAFFGFLVIAWFAVCRHWFDSNARPGGGWLRASWAAVLAVILYELAGMRAYFALMLWLAFGAGLALSLLEASPVRRWRRSVVSASLWILLSQVVVWSGGSLLPPAVQAFLTPWAGAKVGNAPRQAGGPQGEPGIGEAKGEPGLGEPKGEPGIGEPVTQEQVGAGGGKVTGRPAELRIVETARTVLLEPLAVYRQGFVSSGGASQIRGTAEAGRDAARDRPPPLLPAAPPVPAADWSSSVLTGLAATFLPRATGRGLGLFSVGGGQGVWLYVELDTLLFALACAWSGLLTARIAWRAGRISPLALQALVSALLVAAALAYVVTNFGTLFRLREMILMALSLAPLAATTAAKSPE